MMARFNRGNVAALVLSFDALALVCGARPAHAQQAAPSDALEQIVVTAMRRETRLQNTPVAATVVGGDAITRDEIRDLRDLSLNMPSLVMGSDAAFGFNTAIRGIDSAASGIGADPAVGFYLDGVYLGRNASGVFGLADIERIEVLRGPQGTLFGRNTTAGAISIVTRLPTEIPRLMAEATYGAYNTEMLRAVASGPISPTVAGSISLFQSRVDSYAQTNRFTGRKQPPSDETNVRGVLRWRPTSQDDIILRLDGGLTHEDASWPDIVQLPGFNGPATSVTSAAIQATVPSINQLNLNEDTFIHRRDHGASVEINHDLSDGVRLTSLSAYRDNWMSFQLDTDGGSARLARSWMKAEIQNQIAQELRLYSRDARPMQWIAGLYYFREYARSNYFIDRFSLSPPDEIAVNPMNVTNSYAAFGEISDRIWGPLTVRVGARYVQETKDFQNIQVRDLTPDATLPFPRVLPFPAALRRETSKTWRDLSPKFSADVKISDDIMTYASAQRGFKSGGNNFTSSDFTTSPTFNPETVWSYETGLRSQMLQRRLRLNLTGFYMDYRQLQLRENLGPGQAVFRNAANAISQGVEAEGAAVLLPGLTVSGSVTAMNAVFEDYLITVATAASCPGGRFDAATSLCRYTGNHLQRSPHLKGTAGARYQWTVGQADMDAHLTATTAISYPWAPRSWARPTRRGPTV